MSEIIKANPGEIILADGNVVSTEIKVEDVLADFMSQYKATSVKAYNYDLRKFSAYLNIHSVDALAPFFVEHGYPVMLSATLKYKKYLIDKNYAPSTINRRLEAIRALVRFCQVVTLIDWSLPVKGVPQIRSMKSDKSCDEGQFIALLKGAGDQLDPKQAARDIAILWLLFSPSLRVAEVAAMNRKDVDTKRKRVSILGKGRHEKEFITIPKETARALKKWMKFDQKALQRDPLFISLSRACAGHRLTTRAIQQMIKKVGAAAGIDTHPHRLRHLGITMAVRGNPVHLARKFSRHAKLDTVLIYDDDDTDHGGRIADEIASQITELREAQ